MHTRARTVSVHATAGVAGVLSGGIGSFLQAAHATLGPVPLHYGVVSALGLILLVFVGAGIAAHGRSGALTAVLGWLVIVVLMALPRREGDLVLASRTYTYVWLYGGTLLGAMSLLLPYRKLAQLRPPAARSGTESTPVGGG